MKKIISMLMAVVMLLCLVPVQLMAEDANEAVVLDNGGADGLELGDEIVPEGVGEGEVTYPLTIKMYDLAEKKFVDKTFNSPNDKLGQWYKNAGRSDWSYKTFRRIFYGWSTDEKFKEPVDSNILTSSDKIYRDIESISSVEGLSEDTVLYPVITPWYHEGNPDIVEELKKFIQMFEKLGGEFNINYNVTAKDIIPEADVKKDENVPLPIPNPEPTPKPESEKRLITSYYDPDKEFYGVQATSEFTFNDLRIPFLLTENPLGIIKSAKGITDFSGKNPDKYSYVDLVVKLDEKMEVASEQKDWTFESSTFIVSAVLDENYLALNSNITLPSPESLVTKFSFDNPNKLKKFIIRVTPRNDNSDSKYGSTQSYPTDNISKVTGAELLKPMILKTGDTKNVKISKTYAEELAKNNELESINKGSINGNVSINEFYWVILYSFLNSKGYQTTVRPNTPIPEANAKNTMDFDFAIPIVRFDKNTNAYGDTEEQNLGYSKFVVNKAMDSDAFDKDTKPNIDIDKAGEAFISDEDYKVDETKLVVNGKELTFKGWNTKADGKGKFVKKDTVIKYEDLNQRENDRVEEDITLYAVWETKDEPAPKPSEPSTVILTLDENHRGGEITNIEVEVGDLIEPHLYIPRRRGYIFRGWSYDRKHLDEVKPGDRIYTDTTLYAIWKRAEEERVEEPEEIKGEDHKAYIFGYPNGSVRPNGSITRAEAAAMLARLLNIEAIGSAAKPQFTDTESSWYNKAINAVVFRGIMKGYPDGRFRPNAPITRAEFTQMISAIDNKPYGVAPFADVPGHWAERAIGSEYQAKRITGYPDGLFRPDANITRAEAAVILNKIFERKYDNLSLLKCKNPQMIKRFTDLDESFWGWNDMVEATNTHEYVRRYKEDVMKRVEEDWLLIK